MKKLGGFFYVTMRRPDQKIGGTLWSKLRGEIRNPGFDLATFIAGLSAEDKQSLFKLTKEEFDTQQKEFISQANKNK